MKKALVVLAALLAVVAIAHAEDVTDDWSRDEEHIMVFAKHFEIDPRTQKATGDTGRFIVLRKGQSYKGWKLDEDRWRWHTGVGQNQWTGPLAQTVEDYTKLPGVGALIRGFTGNWNRSRLAGATVIDIEYRKSGQIFWRRVQ